MIDTSISTESLHAITLSFPDGYNLWNKFVTENHGGILPMAVYSQYYRVIESRRPGLKDDPVKSDERHKRQDAVESAVLGERDIDLEGSTVYTLRTAKKLPRKWMQISLAKGVLDVKCRRGLHMPSLISLLASMADKKVCTSSGKTWTDADCSDSEYAMNEIECMGSGATWTPSSCSGSTDGSKSSKLEGIMETGLSHLTDTVHQTALDKSCSAAGGSPEQCTSPVPTDRSSFNADMLDAFGGTDVYPEGPKGVIRDGHTAAETDVTYNDDTGICDFKLDKYHKSYWCKRMGMDTLRDLKDKALDPSQSYNDCHTDVGEDLLETFLGQTFTRGLKRFEADMDEKIDDAAVALGDELQKAGGFFSKAGGTGTGSVQYAYHHPAERTGVDVDNLLGTGTIVEDAGKEFDKFTSFIGL